MGGLLSLRYFLTGERKSDDSDNAPSGAMNSILFQLRDKQIEAAIIYYQHIAID
jgi:hypothetical protein